MKINKVVKLIAMDDPQAPKKGTLGYVTSIDDAEQIHVVWENGSTLALIPGKDDFRYVSNQEALNIFEKRFKNAQTPEGVIQAIKQLERWDDETLFVAMRDEMFNSAKEFLSCQTTCTLSDALTSFTDFPNRYEEESKEEIQSMRELTKKELAKYGDIIVPSMDVDPWPIFPEDSGFVDEMHCRLEDAFEELRNMDDSSPIRNINRQIATDGDNDIFIMTRDEYVKELKETVHSFEGDESANICIILSDNEYNSEIKNDYLDAIKNAESEDQNQLFLVIHRLGMTDVVSSLWNDVIDNVKSTYLSQADKIIANLEKALLDNGVDKLSLKLTSSK